MTDARQEGKPPAHWFHVHGVYIPGSESMSLDDLRTALRSRWELVRIDERLRDRPSSRQEWERFHLNSSRQEE